MKIAATVLALGLLWPAVAAAQPAPPEEPAPPWTFGAAAPDERWPRPFAYGDLSFEYRDLVGIPAYSGQVAVVAGYETSHGSWGAALSGGLGRTRRGLTTGGFGMGFEGGLTADRARFGVRVEPIAVLEVRRVTSNEWLYDLGVSHQLFVSLDVARARHAAMFVALRVHFDGYARLHTWSNAGDLGVGCRFW